MPRTLIKSRLNTNKHKSKNKQELNNINSIYLQLFSLLKRNYFLEMVF